LRDGVGANAPAAAWRNARWSHVLLLIVRMFASFWWAAKM